MLIDFRQLFPKYNINPKGVLHIGANIGEEAPVYLDLGIKKQIWIEANPEIFKILCHNIQYNPYAMAFCFAAGNEDKDTILHIANNKGQSSSILELGTHKQQHPDVNFIGDIPVKMYRIDSFFNYSNNDEALWMQQEGIKIKGNEYLSSIDFLNIDVQGFEGNVLRGMGDLIKQIKWAYIEVNKADVYVGCEQIDSIDPFMVAKGFRRVETRWIGNWGDALYIRNEN